MTSKEPKIGKESDYYIYTPSSQATNTFLYPMNVGYFYYESSYKLKRSSYDSFLIMLIKKGYCKGSTGSTTFTAQKDQIVFLDCYAPHTYFSDIDWEAEWIHFDGKLARQYYEIICENNNPVLTLKDNYRFEKYLHKIYTTFRKNEAIKEALLNNWIINILTELLIMKDFHDVPSSSDLIEDIIAYIGEHSSEELSLELLSSKANLSPFYFTKLFKHETGFTPHQYVIISRINNAKYFLKRTSYTIKEICYMTGFNNESSFCTAFKKTTGTTPSIFRELQL